MESVLFWILGVISIITAFNAITGKNLFYNLLLLASFVLSIAGFYLLLEADFLALVQVLIYVGGIVVLLLFAIMLVPKLNVHFTSSFFTWVGGLFLSLLFFILLNLFLEAFPLALYEKGHITLGAIASLLFTEYFLAFEIFGVILLIVMVGIVIIVRGGEF
jgi:NADH:ubiquinone oxidoreductase subunit 6 (subunit J)